MPFLKTDYMSSFAFKWFVLILRSLITLVKELVLFKCLYQLIRCLTMTFKSFVIYRHFCTLMLLQKGFFYQGDSQEDYGSNCNSSTSKWWLCEPRWWISQLPLDLSLKRGSRCVLFVTHQQVKWCTNKWVVAQFNVKKLLGKVNINEIRLF